MSFLNDLFGGSSRSETQRRYEGVGPNPEFLRFLDKTIGRPPSMAELWSILPQGHSLFGGYNKPAGGITVGKENVFAPPPGSGDSSSPVKFTMADITSAYQQDPEKLMDIQRLFKSSKIDPNGFTLDEFNRAIAGADWASGRSRGNFSRALADLSARGELYSGYQTNRFAPPPIPDASTMSGTIDPNANLMPPPPTY